MRLGDDVREGYERKVVSVYRVTVATVGYARAAADNTNHRKRGISEYCVLFSKKEKSRPTCYQHRQQSAHKKLQHVLA